MRLHRGCALAWAGWMSLGCAVIEEPSTEAHGSGTHAQPHAASPRERWDPQDKPGLNTRAGDRTRLVPLGYPEGSVNHLTGIRTDPAGSEEGHLAVPVRLISQAKEKSVPPTEKVAFDPTSRGLLGADGPGGPTGGTARVVDAPRTAARPPPP